MSVIIIRHGLNKDVKYLGQLKDTSSWDVVVRQGPMIQRILCSFEKEQSAHCARKKRIEKVKTVDFNDMSLFIFEIESFNFCICQKTTFA